MPSQRNKPVSPDAALLRHLDRLARQDPAYARLPAPAGMTRHFMDYMGDPYWLLAGTDLDPGQPVPLFVPMLDDLRILANLEARLGLTGMGQQVLAWPYTFIETFFMNAPDLDSAAALMAARVNRMNNHLRIELERRQHYLQMTLYPDVRIGPFARIVLLMMVVFVYRLVTRLCPRAEGTLMVLETGDAQIDSAARAIPLAATEITTRNFGATLIRIPARLLKQRSPGYMPSVWKYIEREERVEQAAQAPIEHLNRASLQDHFMATLLGEGRLPQHADLAQALGLSERTLARRMAAEGISFKALAEHTRKVLALELLADPVLPVSSVARRLGYRDPAGFTRAFRDWFGVTPREWRLGQGGLSPPSS